MIDFASSIILKRMGGGQTIVSYNMCAFYARFDKVDEGWETRERSCSRKGSRRNSFWSEESSGETGSMTSDRASPAPSFHKIAGLKAQFIRATSSGLQRHHGIIKEFQGGPQAPIQEREPIDTQAYILRFN